MSSDELDRMIDWLEEMMPDDPGLLGIGARRQDWAPFWARAKEVQLGFNSGVRYPTKELRQTAWNRFNGIRDEASRRANVERDHLSTRSSHHREVIFDQCRGIGWSAVTDDIFFLDRTTVEDMKARGRYLGDVKKYFSEHKDEMLGEDKRACHNRIQEIKEEQERFWERHREAGAERTRANLEKNRNRYQSVANALERERERASDIREKISGSTSEKWIEIWSGWLAESESKIDDMESTLQQIDGWIEEDERRLGELGG